MKRAQGLWLQDIVDAVDAIRLAEEVLDDSRDENGDPNAAVVAVVIDALTYRVMTIGEAVKNLSEPVRAARPGIPWKSISGMRDVIAHQYHRRNVALIRLTVDEHLQPLHDATTWLLEEWEDDGELSL